MDGIFFTVETFKRCSKKCVAVSFQHNLLPGRLVSRDFKRSSFLISIIYFCHSQRIRSYTNLNVANMNFNVANANFNIANANFNVANTNFNIANANFNIANTNFNIANVNFNVANTNFNVANTN